MVEESEEIKHSYGVKKCQQYDINAYSRIESQREDVLEDDCLALEEGDNDTLMIATNNCTIDTTPSTFMSNAFTIDDHTETKVDNANVNVHHCNKENPRTCEADGDDDELL